MSYTEDIEYIEIAELVETLPAEIKTIAQDNLNSSKNLEPERKMKVYAALKQLFIDVAENRRPTEIEYADPDLQKSIEILSRAQCRHILDDFILAMQYLLGNVLLGEPDGVLRFSELNDYFLSNGEDYLRFNKIAFQANWEKLNVTQCHLEEAFRQLCSTPRIVIKEARIKSKWDLAYFADIARDNKLKEVGVLTYLAKKCLEEGNIFDKTSWKLKAL